MVGPSGTERILLALALGYKTAEQGYSVRFFTASGLANQLAETKEQRSLTKLEEKLAECHLLNLYALLRILFPASD